MPGFTRKRTLAEAALEVRGDERLEREEPAQERSCRREDRRVDERGAARTDPPVPTSIASPLRMRPRSRASRRCRRRCADRGLRPEADPGAADAGGEQEPRARRRRLRRAHAEHHREARDQREARHEVRWSCSGSRSEPTARMGPAARNGIHTRVRMSPLSTRTPPLLSLSSPRRARALYAEAGKAPTGGEPAG